MAMYDVSHGKYSSLIFSCREWLNPDSLKTRSIYLKKGLDHVLV
uniref:PLAT domain-containing protein n=1 Tax=Arundo donax TaxID=35708 RepID=A0A0A8YP17_ARUDO